MRNFEFERPILGLTVHCLCLAWNVPAYTGIYRYIPVYTGKTHTSSKSDIQKVPYINTNRLAVVVDRYVLNTAIKHHATRMKACELFSTPAAAPDLHTFMRNPINLAKVRCKARRKNLKRPNFGRRCAPIIPTPLIGTVIPCGS